ncbi:helix-turn-helix transcriptional regulator [uncultured Enorma sp.]|uniref:helix-turn-helix transcriptional regulator n=1 Tax=uncultured Enorma sp. TaxID=1714346 RepID=UPI002803D26A|nr:helix-turn-helix transcriptional regulator [uncultured Enorma sp.]
MSFRDNLQHLRATRNMTQEQLAMLLGVSRQSVTKWEAEKSYPEMDKLLKMCQIFECSLDDLVQGDLTDRTPEPGAAHVPAGPPTDICGYDDHQRMMAWKVPTGVAAILLGIAVAFFFEDTLAVGEFNGNGGLFILIVLAGILAGLAFLIPAGMEHSAFQKAHPYVEDFYTEDDKARARKIFSAGLIAGIAFIFAGIGCLIMLEETAENVALFFLMFFIALGVWNIVHYSMLFVRTNVAEYNKSVGEDLELEEILDMQVDEARREQLLRQNQKNKKLGAVCTAIMIAATIVGLALLFAPVLASPDPDAFEPEGTSAMWFWLAWPVGGLICGIVAVLWDAFGKQNDQMG